VNGGGRGQIDRGPFVVRSDEGEACADRPPALPVDLAGVIVIPGDMFVTDAPPDAQPKPVRAVSPVMRPDEGTLAAAAAGEPGLARARKNHDAVIIAV
jgi:hypothetical protein